MIILGIETSCDETAAAILEGPNKDGRVTILSNVIASSQSIMAKYGGVIPEQAAREQLKAIISVVKEALEQANLKPSQLDGIAVTQGPGLIGSLLVGVETAKVLALTWNKPLIPINHLLGHFYANWISDNPTFPLIGLLVSGGHSDLILLTGHGRYQYLGGTRDDAAGECFDKSARALGLPYPGGPALSKMAQQGDPQAFKLPRPMLDSPDYDFSFSGLKTSVINRISEYPSIGLSEKADLCASIEAAIVEVLVKKTIKAAREYKVEQIMVAGGVAANQTLTKQFLKLFHGQVIIPPPSLCTDNAAMIASAAIFNYQPTDPLTLDANPSLHL